MGGGQGIGSSPLTRGKPGVDARREHGGGLIPAHAGKTLWERVLGDAAWAHPRSRGENAHAGRKLRGNGGSSPLTRGKRAWAGGDVDALGLIPAHAGKTNCSLQTN